MRSKSTNYMRKEDQNKPSFRWVLGTYTKVSTEYKVKKIKKK